LNRIVRQRHADAAEAVASCRAQALIRDLALETLLREAADPIVRRQARGDPRFASLLLRIACATAWSHPDEADEIFQNAASGSSESTWLEVAYDIRVRTRDVYEQWRGHFPKTTVLDRFLRIFDSLEPDALEVERGRLAASARARPVEYAEALAALWADEEHELPVHLLEGLGAGDELEEEDDHEDEVLEPLGPREREMMRAALHATDKALGRDFGNTLSSLALGGIIVGTIYLFGAQGAWGWAGVAALIAWILVGLSRSDRGLYARIIRPQLAKLVARTSCTPAEILQELKVVTKLSDDVGRFKDEIAEDAGLELLSRILRINR
jgi:hypothetical protein